MSDVTVLGLGAMGTALAQRVNDAGIDTVVWNRTPARADALAARGVRHATDVATAISESPAVIACVADYAAADSFLRTPEAEAALRGRSLIQLSTGSPKLARAASDWATSIGARYVDGAIMVYPADIGAEDAMILLSGDTSAVDECWPLIETLAPASKYLGADPGLASAMDEALLCLGLSSIIGAINGAALCEASGISVQDYRQLAEKFSPVVNGAVSLATQKIADDDLVSTEASLATWAGTLDHMIETAREAGYSDAIPAAYQRLFDRAKERGLAEHDSAALIEILRPD